MIYKKATYTVSKQDVISFKGESQPLTDGMIRTAAARLSIKTDTDDETGKLIAGEIKDHPRALFFRAKAIVADEVNSNGDFFSKEELLASYGTFVNVPFFTNHNNQDVENARGKIIHSEWVDSENAIYVIGFVDREAYPHICRGIEEDYMTGVSMGCLVENSSCSICGNSAANVDEYCNHIRFKKGRRFTGSAKDVKTGEVRNFKDALVYEKNSGIRFIELSGVGDPACRTCRIEGIFNNEEAMKKAANIQNNLFMFRQSSLAQEAGQQEVEMLNQSLQNIQAVTVDILNSRPQVEMDFASDLVKVLSDLQAVTDELVGAGYGQLAAGAGAVPGVDEALGGMGDMGGVPAAPSEQFGAPPQQISQDMGNTVGTPGAPAMTPPSAPTPPVKSLGASDVKEMLKKISSSLETLTNFKVKSSKLKEGEIDMQRRTPNVVKSQKTEVMAALDDSWQEKTTNSENRDKDINYIANYENNGGKEMNREAARYDAPDQITEQQLGQSKGTHPRETTESNSTTQEQLKTVRKDSEPDQTHEAQLSGVRKNEVRETITENQLQTQPDGSLSRKEEDQNSTTQEQLRDRGYKKDQEQDVITEKQLDNKADFFYRPAFTRTDIKTADEHLSDVTKVLARTAMFYGTTPKQILSTASEMVSSIFLKHRLLESITSKVKDSERGQTLEVAAGMKYWGGKEGMKLSGASSHDILAKLDSSLRILVASDEHIHPEYVVEGLDILSEGEIGEELVSDSIDELLNSEDVVEHKEASARDSMKIALKSKTNPDQPELTEPAVLASIDQRKIERQAILKAVTAPTHIIEASLEEVGLSKSDIEEAKTNKVLRASVEEKISAFATWASKKSGQKFAGKEGITNVEVEGDQINIAISWKDGDGELEGSVDLSLPGSDEDLEPDLLAPEGDIAGDNLDELMGAAPVAEGIPAAPAVAGPVASASNRMTRKAQSPGGGGIPGAPLGGAGEPADALMGGPGEDPGVQSFSEQEDDGGGEDGIPGVGEQMLPGSICPFCRSTDTNVGEEGREAGTFACNGCGAVYKFAVNVEVLNPSNMSFDKEDKVGNVAEPELPEMPVAAEIDLSRGNLTRISEQEKKHGHVCPACGTEECKSEEGTEHYASYVCPACNTKTSKEIVISSADPDKSFMRVAWNIQPKKLFTIAGCKDCRTAALRLLAKKKVQMMLKTASSTKGKFPMANCIERLARRYGGNAVSTFGDCKGKPLADCVCKQLETFASVLNKNRHLEKFADTYMQKDPMEECTKDHKSQGYTGDQSMTICEALKAENLSEEDTNMFIAALEDDPDFTRHELRAMDEAFKAIKRESQELPDFDLDESEIGEELPELTDGPEPPLPEEEIGEDTVTIELPADVAADIEQQISEKSSEGIEEIESPEAPEDIPIAPDVVDGAPDIGSASELEIGASTQKDKIMKKEAAKQKHVENIETEVGAGIPRADAKMGNESKENIDKPMAKPSIPRGNAEMGQESSPKAGAPDLATGNQYLGHEREVQSGMPGLSLKGKDTVIAEVTQGLVKANNGQELSADQKQIVAATVEAMMKEAKTPEHVKNIETEVGAGIPRADGTIGNEGKDNINVSTKDGPDVPRASATMGKEGPDNIDVAEKKVDVPADSAYMGKEKEVQSDMPALGVKEKGTVIADEDKAKQLDKIATARWKKASQVAARYLAAGAIANEEYDQVVEDLSKLSFERIETFAERMLQKTAPIVTQAATEGQLTTAVVMSPTELVKPAETKPTTLADALAGSFTHGNQALTQRLNAED